jgi:hypothetical protein
MNIPLPNEYIYITIYKFITIIMRVCFDILTSALCHHRFSLIPKAQSGFFFQFCGVAGLVIIHKKTSPNLATERKVNFKKKIYYKQEPMV